MPNRRRRRQQPRLHRDQRGATLFDYLALCGVVAGVGVAVAGQLEPSAEEAARRGLCGITDPLGGTCSETASDETIEVRNPGDGTVAIATRSVFSNYLEEDGWTVLSAEERVARHIDPSEAIPDVSSESNLDALAAQVDGRFGRVEQVAVQGALPWLFSALGAGAALTWWNPFAQTQEDVDSYDPGDHPGSDPPPAEGRSVERLESHPGQVSLVRLPDGRFEFTNSYRTNPVESELRDGELVAELPPAEGTTEPQVVRLGVVAEGTLYVDWPAAEAVSRYVTGTDVERLLNDVRGEGRGGDAVRKIKTLTTPIEDHGEQRAFIQPDSKEVRDIKWVDGGIAALVEGPTREDAREGRDQAPDGVIQTVWTNQSQPRSLELEGAEGELADADLVFEPAKERVVLHLPDGFRADGETARRFFELARNDQTVVQALTDADLVVLGIGPDVEVSARARDVLKGSVDYDHLDAVQTDLEQGFEETRQAADVSVETVMEWLEVDHWLLEMALTDLQGTTRAHHEQLGMPEPWRQNVLEHSVLLTAPFRIALTMRPGLVQDRGLVLTAPPLHDLPEYRTGDSISGSIPADVKFETEKAVMDDLLDMIGIEFQVPYDRWIRYEDRTEGWALLLADIDKLYAAVDVVEIEMLAKSEPRLAAIVQSETWPKTAGLWPKILEEKIVDPQLRLVFEDLVKLSRAGEMEGNGDVRRWFLNRLAQPDQYVPSTGRR